MNEIVGTFGVLSRNRDEATAALKHVDAVARIVEHQLTLRGDLLAFTFKAYGHRWRWQPTTPYTLPEVKLSE